MGLNNWAAVHINKIGNLAERDYSIDDIRECLDKIALYVPSLDVRIHCGADWEEDACIGTLIKEPLKPAYLTEPEVSIIPGITEEQYISVIRQYL